MADKSSHSPREVRLDADLRGCSSTSPRGLDYLSKAEYTFKLGIDGFGLLGQAVIRACLHRPWLQIAAINDPDLNHEQVMTRLRAWLPETSELSISDGESGPRINVVDGSMNQTIHLLREKKPNPIAWHTAGIFYVVCTTSCTDGEQAKSHLHDEGPFKVLLADSSVRNVPRFACNSKKFRYKAKERVFALMQPGASGPLAKISALFGQASPRLLTPSEKAESLVDLLVEVISRDAVGAGWIYAFLVYGREDYRPWPDLFELCAQWFLGPPAVGHDNPAAIDSAESDNPIPWFPDEATRARYQKWWADWDKDGDV